MPHDDPLLTLKDVQRYYAPYTKTHIYNMMREGKFPQRVTIGANRVAWRQSELDAWLDERARSAAGHGVAARAS